MREIYGRYARPVVGEVHVLSLVRAERDGTRT
jgi:hypothetical protein